MNAQLQFFFLIKNLQMCIFLYDSNNLVCYNVIVLSVLGRIRFPAQNLVSLTIFHDNFVSLY